MQQVLRLRGTIARETKWDIVVDLFFYRDPEEAEKEEQAAKEQVVAKPEVVAHEPADLDWTTTEPQQWADDSAPVVPAAAPAAAAAVPAAFPAPNDDWAQQVQDDWTANAATAPQVQPNWGGTSDWH